MSQTETRYIHIVDSIMLTFAWKIGKVSWKGYVQLPGRLPLLGGSPIDANFEIKDKRYVGYLVTFEGALETALRASRLPVVYGNEMTMKRALRNTRPRKSNV